MPRIAKASRALGTAAIGIFVAQLVLAVGGSLLGLRHGVLYPVFVGRGPSTHAMLALNITLLAAALCAFYFAEKIERDARPAGPPSRDGRFAEPATHDQREEDRGLKNA